MSDFIVVVGWLVFSLMGSADNSAERHIQCEVIDTCPGEELCIEKVCVWK